MDVLSGYKTYILALFGAVVWIFGQLNWISVDLATQILTPIGALIVLTLRQAIAKTAQTTQLMPALVKPEVAEAIAVGASVPTGKPIVKG